MMQDWRDPREPKLDDLLEDEAMRMIVRSTGLTTGEFREQLSLLACRFHRRRSGAGRSWRRCAA